MATSYYESFIKKPKEIFMMDHMRSWTSASIAS